MLSFPSENDNFFPNQSGVLKKTDPGKRKTNIFLILTLGVEIIGSELFLKNITELDRLMINVDWLVALLAKAFFCTQKWGGFRYFCSKILSNFEKSLYFVESSSFVLRFLRNMGCAWLSDDLT